VLSAVFGFIAILLGLWGVQSWSGDLWHFLKGIVPVSLVFAGLIAIIAGLAPKAPPSKKGS
jgi:hypothetical protein